jgi:hypothetical protein
VTLDATTGSVMLGDSGVLGSHLTKKYFCEEGSARFRQVSANNDWARFSCRVTDHHGEFAISVILKSNRISEIHLAKVQGPGSWGNWSEESEREKQVEHDRMLENILGKPPYRYPWGEIVSVYDAKGGASEIVIRYTNSV